MGYVSVEPDQLSLPSLRGQSISSDPWFRDACEVLNRLTVVGRKSEKGAHIADTLWHRPVLNRLDFLLLEVNARGSNHVTQKGDSFLEQGALRGFDLETYIM